MQYELSLWEQLATDTSPVPAPGASPTQPLEEILRAESTRLHEVFQQVLASAASDTIKERYVQLHQLSLLNFTDLLLHKPTHNTPADHYLLLSHLEELLHFLVQVAPQYVLPAKTAADLNPAAPASGYGIDDQKVVTSLRSAELGLLLRLFIETGVFRTRNRKGLSRFMAHYVVTFHKNVTEALSSDHLYSMIYTTTEPTLDSTQDILHKMLNQLNKIRIALRKKR